MWQVDVHIDAPDRWAPAPPPHPLTPSPLGHDLARNLMPAIIVIAFSQWDTRSDIDTLAVELDAQLFDTGAHVATWLISGQQAHCIWN